MFHQGSLATLVDRFLSPDFDAEGLDPAALGL